VHGLNPNFGNELVAAKTVNLLQATVDYFDRLGDEETRLAKAAKDQRQPSWSELAATIMATQETQRRIDAWRPRPAVSGQSLASLGKPHSLSAGSPEAAAAIYLEAIVARNFGTLAEMTIDSPLRSINYRASCRREELCNLKLTGWAITGLRDVAPSVSVVDVALEGILNDSLWSATEVMRLIYNDEKFEVRVRDAPDGSWTVVPSFLPNLWGTAVGSLSKGKSPADGD